jgi:hypothetical protein
MKYIPSFEERDTEELIAIANCNNDDWQKEAVKLAQAELKKRNISKEYQQEVINEWQDNYNKFLRQQEAEFQKNENEKYSIGQCIIIFLLAPFILLGRIHYDLSVSSLRRLNYTIKARQRLILLTTSAITFCSAFYLISHI